MKGMFVIICIGLIIFLLLPFLETQPPATTALQTATPQVSTANPLAAIAKRLFSLLPKKAERTRTFTAKNTFPNTAQEFFPNGENRFASQPGVLPVTTPNALAGTAQPAPEPTALDFGNATFQTDQGEWVLIRQTTPQHSDPGMHEVNVHENPYDRYVRQERANRFGPHAQQSQIPDSKWARFTRPIKEFFGIESASPVSAPLMAVRSDNGGLPYNGSSSARLTDRGQTVSGLGRVRVPFPDITPQQWAAMSPQEQQQVREHHALTQFADLLTGDSVAEEAAAISANAKYPNPQNEAEQQEKENYKRRLTEENKQKIREGLLQAMQAQAAASQPVDEVGNMLNCINSSLPSAGCSSEVDPETGHPLPPAPLSEDEIAAGQIKNAADFRAQTGFVLPQDLPITVVFGPTDPQTLAQLAHQPNDNPEVKRAAEILDFLYQAQDCANQDCFGVTNSPQRDQQMAQVMELNTAKLKEDPLGVYPPFEPKFVDYKVAQMQEQLEQSQADDETKQKMLDYAREDAKKQFHENAPHLVFYQGKQVGQMQRNSFAALDRNNPQADSSKATIIFVGNGNAAPQVAQYTGPYIVYHQDTLSNAQGVVEAGQQVNHSFSSTVNTAKEVSNEVLGQAAQGSAQTAVQGINRIIGQNNTQNKGLPGLLDAFGNRSGKK